MPVGSKKKTWDWLKDNGFFRGDVEVYNPHANCHQDLWGLFDLVALHPSRGVWFIQACKNDASRHIKKYEADPQLMRRLVTVANTPGVTVVMIEWRSRKVKPGGVAVKLVPVFRDFDVLVEKWKILSKDELMARRVTSIQFNK